MLFFLFGAMCLLAIGFAVRPLLRDARRLGVLTGASIVFVTALSAGLYAYTGQPGVPSGRSQQPDVEDVIQSLAARLEREPGDLAGWLMLGRSYLALGNFDGAVDAFERAAELESPQTAQTLVSLGAALAQRDGQQLTPRAIALFENAVALEPDYPEALFWGGIAAFNRGDTALAADRWERLLATNPPPEVAGILEQRIAVWRGEQPPQTAPPVADPAAAAGSDGEVVRASITLSEAAKGALPPEATVFVIARDPAQPSPPIAVTRRRLSELPVTVGLRDRDSMIPGRSLSGFAEFELVARVSLSGSPGAQPGDWFGSAIVRPADSAAVSLSIDEEVR